MILRQNSKTYTGKLIIVNVVVFFLSLIAGLIIGNDFISLLALNPDSLLNGSRIWSLITSMFMHASLTHLFVNMFSLYFVGRLVEKIIGAKRFLWLYLGSGIFAGIFYAALAGTLGTTSLGAQIFGSPFSLGVGASGALFGLIGILAVITPHSRVTLIVGPIVAIVLQFIVGGLGVRGGLLDIVSLLVNVYFFIAIFSMISFSSRTRKYALPIEMPFWILPFIAILPLMLVSLFVSLPIGNSAHLGGLIAGLAYGFYLKEKFPRRTKMIGSYFSR